MLPLFQEKVKKAKKNTIMAAISLKGEKQIYFFQSIFIFWGSCIRSFWREMPTSWNRLSSLKNSVWKIGQWARVVSVPSEKILVTHVFLLPKYDINSNRSFIYHNMSLMNKFAFSLPTIFLHLRHFTYFLFFHSFLFFHYFHCFCIVKGPYFNRKFCYFIFFQGRKE